MSSIRLLLRCAWQSQAEGLAVEMLSAQQLRDKEPHAQPHLLGAVSMPMAASVNPRKLMLALLAEVSMFQDDAPPVAWGSGGSGQGGEKRGRARVFWGHTVAGIMDDDSGGACWTRVTLRQNNGWRAAAAALFGRAAACIFGGEVVLRTRATVLAVGPHSQRVAMQLLSTHVPIIPVVGTMLRLQGPVGHAPVLKHILFSYESTLVFEKERAHQAALRLSSYRAMPARRGETPKGGGGGGGAPFSAHDKETWKMLKEEGQPIPGRPEVFEWRGRVLLQPRTDAEGRLVVEEEGTGDVILRTEGVKTPAPSWPYAKGETYKMPVQHLERLICPPGVTHAVGDVPSQRRTRHLYGKQADDTSLWFGGDRMAAPWWAPWLWRGGACAPAHSTLSVRQHVASILGLLESFVTVHTWQGVMAFATDGEPYIGRLPCEGARNVYMLSALASEGVARALEAGSLLAQLVAAGISVDRDDASSAPAAARVLELERELAGAVPSRERGVMPARDFYAELQRRPGPSFLSLDPRLLVPSSKVGLALNVTAARIYLTGARLYAAHALQRPHQFPLFVAAAAAAAAALVGGMCRKER